MRDDWWDEGQAVGMGLRSVVVTVEMTAVSMAVGRVGR
jgi:hypothetical protein